MDIAEKEIDDLGRIVIPKSWRKHLGRHVVLYHIGDEIRVRSKKDKPLSKLPRIEIDLASKLTDWHSVKKELLQKHALS